MFFSFIVLSFLIIGFSSNQKAISTENEIQSSTTSRTVFLTIEGENQGEITSDVTIAGREGMIKILSYSHQIISPRDAASGLPTGKRQHFPLKIVKLIDKTSPLLMNILVFNENIIKFELRFYQNSTGTDTNYYTIELTNAQIAGISNSGSSMGNTEVVSFTYQKITWIWVDGGIESTDDWETPVV
jgi:type VI secretion system secreted protein Hcp